MKASGEQLDERIAEVHWDPARENWRLMRFRDDKPNGNHRSVVEKILQSIEDGVEKDQVGLPISHPPHHLCPLMSSSVAHLSRRGDPPCMESARGSSRGGTTRRGPAAASQPERRRATRARATTGTRA